MPFLKSPYSIINHIRIIISFHVSSLYVYTYQRLCVYETTFSMRRERDNWEDSGIHTHTRRSGTPKWTPLRTKCRAAEGESSRDVTSVRSASAGASPCVRTSNYVTNVDGSFHAVVCLYRSSWYDVEGLTKNRMNNREHRAV